jgi:hypothetical protein
MKRIILLSLFFVFAFVNIAHPDKSEEIILDKSNQPVPFANVVFKGQIQE